jgi:hypothetical protein
MMKEKVIAHMVSGIMWATSFTIVVQTLSGLKQDDYPSYIVIETPSQIPSDLSLYGYELEETYTVEIGNSDDNKIGNVFKKSRV